jgi:hypothetical protein
LATDSEARVRFPALPEKKVVCLERGPLSLVNTTEELLDRKEAAPVYKTENTAVGIRHADHVAPSIRKSWQSLHRHAVVARSVEFARGLRPWSFIMRPRTGKGTSVRYNVQSGTDTNHDNECSDFQQADLVNNKSIKLRIIGFVDFVHRPEL